MTKAQQAADAKTLAKGMQDLASINDMTWPPWMGWLVIFGSAAIAGLLIWFAVFMARHQ